MADKKPLFSRFKFLFDYIPVVNAMTQAIQKLLEASKNTEEYFKKDRNRLPYNRSGRAKKIYKELRKLEAKGSKNPAADYRAKKIANDQSRFKNIVKGAYTHLKFGILAPAVAKTLVGNISASYANELRGDENTLRAKESRSKMVQNTGMGGVSLNNQQTQTIIDRSQAIADEVTKQSNLMAMEHGETGIFGIVKDEFANNYWEKFATELFYGN